MLIADPLLSVESVLANRGATPLQQLKRWSIQTATHQIRNRVGTAVLFPSGNWNQQSLLWQVALEDLAERLQCVDVVIAPQ